MSNTISFQSENDLDEISGINKGEVIGKVKAKRKAKKKSNAVYRRKRKKT